MNQKRAGLIFIFLITSLLLSSLVVSAASDDSKVSKFVSSVESFFQPILKGVFGQNAQLLELLLFALLIIAVVYSALNRVSLFQNSPFALWIITLVIAILATRYIGTIDVVNALLFPTGVMGIAMLSILPFALFFWFVEFGMKGAKNRVLRRVAWVAFAIIYLFVWFKQFYIPANPGSSIFFGLIQVTEPTPAGISDWGWMYLLVFFASIAMLFLDGTIQGSIAKSRVETIVEVHKSKSAMALMSDIDKLRETIEKNATAIESRDYHNAYDELLERARALDREALVRSLPKPR